MKRISILIFTLIFFIAFKANCQSSDFLRGVNVGKKDAVMSLTGYGIWYHGITGGGTIEPGTVPSLSSISYDETSATITLQYSSGTSSSFNFTRADVFGWYYPNARSDFQFYCTQYLNNIADQMIDAPTQAEKEFLLGLTNGFQLAAQFY